MGTGFYVFNEALENNDLESISPAIWAGGFREWQRNIACNMIDGD